MADRVHPHDSLPAGEDLNTTSSQNPQSPPKPSHPDLTKPVPPPRTYVIAIAKDQIYRVPSPEEARRFQQLSRRKPRRNRCRTCVCLLLAVLLILAVLLGAGAGIFYLVFKPEAIKYSVDNLVIKGFNLTTMSSISPEFDVTLRSENRNDHIGIYYEQGSAGKVYYKEIKLSDGVLPEFYQPPNNVTVIPTAMKGFGLALGSTVWNELVDGQNRGTVSFKLNFRVPVRFKVGTVQTWEIIVKVSCDVAVDDLTATAKIVSKVCDYGVEIW